MLCLFPDWFAAPQPDWPANHRQTGFPLFNDIDDPLPDPELEAFLAAGEPPVVFTAGSTRVDGAGFARATAEAMRVTGTRGILITPDAAPHDPAEHHDGRDMPRLLTRRYLPLRRLLPRCRALVHHGGIGTASLAYEAGIAQVVMPSAHDQFDNAQRVADSGCGVRLDAPVESAALAAALGYVLRDEGVALRCAQLAAALAAAPDGCLEAARFIERFVPEPAAPAERIAPGGGIDGEPAPRGCRGATGPGLAAPEASGA